MPILSRIDECRVAALNESLEDIIERVNKLGHTVEETDQLILDSYELEIKKDRESLNLWDSLEELTDKINVLVMTDPHSIQFRERTDNPGI